MTALRGATIVGAAVESSTSKRGRQAADDSPPTRGRQRRSTPESREKDAARKKLFRERSSTPESREKDAARKQAARSKLSATDKADAKEAAALHMKRIRLMQAAEPDDDEPGDEYAQASQIHVSCWRRRGASF